MKRTFALVALLAALGVLCKLTLKEAPRAGSDREAPARGPASTSGPKGADPEAALLARYPDGLVPQGISAELIAARWKLDRDSLDAFAAESHRRAAAATTLGSFASEILPVVLRHLQMASNIELQLTATASAPNAPGGAAMPGARPAPR